MKKEKLTVPYAVCARGTKLWTPKAVKFHKCLKNVQDTTTKPEQLA